MRTQSYRKIERRYSLRLVEQLIIITKRKHFDVCLYVDTIREG